MAICPECNGEMGQTETVCPSCGFDFPADVAGRDASEKSGLAYSPLARLALVVGAMAAGLGCAIVLVLSLVALSNGELLDGLVFGPTRT